MYSATNIALLLATAAAGAAAKGISCTPHDSYSSSIGVLGCKVNTDRIAYWPGSVGCDNICVKLTHGSRSVHLLRVDQSGGAYDISYDAWVYLQTGKPASSDPIAGGGVAMEYEEADASACADLLLTDGNRLPLSAANSMNYLTSCLGEPNSFVAKNHVLYNIADPICSMGYDEECKLDLATSNQPSCGHQLGVQTKLTSAPVYNVKYQTGKTELAATGEEVAAQNQGSKAAAVDSGSSSQQAGSSSAVSSAPATSQAAPVPVPEVPSPKVEQAPPSTSAAPVVESTPVEEPVKTPAGAVFVPSTSETATPEAVSTSSEIVSSTSSSSSSSSEEVESTTSSPASSSPKPYPTTSTSSSSPSTAHTTMSKVIVTKPSSTGTGITVPSGVASGTGSASNPSSSPSGTPPVVDNAGASIRMSSAALAIAVAGVLAAF